MGDSAESAVCRSASSLGITISKSDETVKVLVVIPARADSKGIRNKNTRRLGGHSLIQYAIRACMACPDVQAQDAVNGPSARACAREECPERDVSG